MTVTAAPQTLTWFVAHNGTDVWHLVEVDASCIITTGLSSLEQFSTKELAIARIPEQYRPIEEESLVEPPVL